MKKKQKIKRRSFKEARQMLKLFLKEGEPKNLKVVRMPPPHLLKKMKDKGEVCPKCKVNLEFFSDSDMPYAGLLEYVCPKCGEIFTFFIMKNRP